MEGQNLPRRSKLKRWRMSRPRKPIDWPNVDKLCALQATEINKIARDIVQDIWGPTPIPAFIDPIRQVRKMIKLLTKDEQKFWSGTPFNPYRRAASSLDGRITSAVREHVRKYNQSGSTPWEFCGFTLNDLKTHIERRFDPWMTWDNWGEWHIDHVIPRSRYLKPFSRERVFGLENLRPISSTANLRKGAKTDVTT